MRIREVIRVAALGCAMEYYGCGGGQKKRVSQPVSPASVEQTVIPPPVPDQPDQPNNLPDQPEPHVDTKLETTSAVAQVIDMSALHAKGASLIDLLWADETDANETDNDETTIPSLKISKALRGLSAVKNKLKQQRSKATAADPTVTENETPKEDITFDDMDEDTKNLHRALFDAFDDSLVKEDFEQMKEEGLGGDSSSLPLDGSPANGDPSNGSSNGSTNLQDSTNVDAEKKSKLVHAKALQSVLSGVRMFRDGLPESADDHKFNLSKGNKKNGEGGWEWKLSLGSAARIANVLNKKLRKARIALAAKTKEGEIARSMEKLAIEIAEAKSKEEAKLALAKWEADLKKRVEDDDWDTGDDETKKEEPKSIMSMDAFKGLATEFQKQSKNAGGSHKVVKVDLKPNELDKKRVNDLQGKLQFRIGGGPQQQSGTPPATGQQTTTEERKAAAEPTRLVGKLETDQNGDVAKLFGAKTGGKQGPVSPPAVVKPSLPVAEPKVKLTVGNDVTVDPRLMKLTEWLLDFSWEEVVGPVTRKAADNDSDDDDDDSFPQKEQVKQHLVGLFANAKKNITPIDATSLFTEFAAYKAKHLKKDTDISATFIAFIDKALSNDANSPIRFFATTIAFSQQPVLQRRKNMRVDETVNQTRLIAFIKDLNEAPEESVEYQETKYSLKAAIPSETNNLLLYAIKA